MRVLITGGTGFIGARLGQALILKDHEVFALSHSGNNARIASLLEHKNFHLVSGDIRSLTTIQEIAATNNVDIVIHLAASPSHGPQDISQNFNHFEVNARGTLNVLHSCFLARIPRIIYASAMGVYGQPEYLPVDENHPKKPLEFINLTKLQGEDYCEFYARNCGLHVIVLRYAGVYGPGKIKGAAYNFIQTALRGQPFQISSDGNQTRDLVYIGDVINATLKAMDFVDNVTFDVFNVGSGRETSINELATKVIKATGSGIDFTYKSASSDDRFVLDISKAREILDYKPRSLEEAIKEFVQFLKSGG